MDKEKQILEYSDPYAVLRTAKKLLGSDVELFISPNKNKKYAIKNPDGKWVHFGYFGMEDWTKHKNPIRRELFKKRNAKWADSPKWSPSWLSYYLLW